MARHTLSNPNDNQRVVARLGSIQPICARQWGTMTPHEMVCHLLDSYRMVMGEIPCRPAPRSEQPAPFLPRAFVKWVALEVPLKWPPGVLTRPEIDPRRQGSRPAAFDREQKQLLALHERFVRRPMDYSYAVHPIFGVMNESEWMRWAYLHADHHLRQFGL